MLPSGRTIYAPIRRGDQEAAALRDANQTSLKYLDEGSEASSSGGGGGSWSQRQPTDLTSSHKHHECDSIEQIQSHDDDNDDDDDDDDDYQREERERSVSAEEVYLCNCCGTSKQLDPAMEFLPAFRSLFALFNLLALALGSASLAMGLWFRIDPKVYELHHYIETQNFTTAGWLMLVGGALVASLTLFVGCAASARKSICLLLFYSISLTILTIVSITTLVLLIVYGLGDSLERHLAKEVYEQLRRRSMGVEMSDPLGSSEASQFIDFVQVKLRCCGAQDFRDYQRLGSLVPTTCYTIGANFVQAPGCGQALRELFDLRAGLAAGLSAASALVQLLATLMAGLMVCAIYNYRATPRPISVASSSSVGRPRSRQSGAADSPERLEPVHFQRAINNYPVPQAHNLSRTVSRGEIEV